MYIQSKAESHSDSTSNETLCIAGDRKMTKNSDVVAKIPLLKRMQRKNPIVGDENNDFPRVIDLRDFASLS